jgi:fatty acid desaturase
MVRFSSATVLAVTVSSLHLSVGIVGAFQVGGGTRRTIGRKVTPISIRRSTSTTTRRTAIAIENVQELTNIVSKQTDDDDERKGAMPLNLSGIAFSGLKGQALSNLNAEFPKTADVRAVIPADCFESDTVKSLSCLAVSLVGTALCTFAGVNLLPILSPANPLTWPLWAAYSVVTGTVAMGLWVLAHECGHGAFSKNKMLQDTVGFVLHSFMLVPYYSWQRSHAVHHQYTNHMELGETHVPERFVEGDEEASYRLRSKFLDLLPSNIGMKVWGAFQGFLHLVIGWPAYLLIGATGGPDRGMTNHFYPNPLTTPTQPKRELFPGNWKEKVYQSDIGIAAMVGVLVAWTICHGVTEVMALYGGPLLIVNAWLVLYTWLQHTDVDVPHFSADNHNFVKGALHTIDRPYDKLDRWGIIDYLHHKIGSTHVAHHFDSTIPHYKAQAATEAIKKAFPEFYLYDPTPIPQALWRVCKGCTAVEKRNNVWVWKNDGLEDAVSGATSNTITEATS